MSDHECQRIRGEGFCRTCGRFMGDPDHPKAKNVDRWDDPETLDRDPDDDLESVIWRSDLPGRRTRKEW
jgi:hypothetical protein